MSLNVIKMLLHHGLSPQGAISDQERKKLKRKGDRYTMQTSLIVATLKRMLPVGLNICAPGDQELIALAKNRFTQVCWITVACWLEQ